MEIQNYVFFSFFLFFLTHGRFFLLWVVSKWKPDRSELIWIGGGGAYAKRFKFIKGDKRAVSGWKPLQNWLSQGLGEARVDTNML